jgi:glucose-1-phosphate cytidylyltransferase
MKTVLFCGGLGTRIRDVSESVPKPMIPIGDKPVLWHLMHYYSQFGHRTSFCASATRQTSSRNSF